jgi:hypothetical protein
MAADTQERLALRRAQGHAKTLEAQQEARNAAVSILGQPLGQPLDLNPGPPPAARVGDFKAPPKSNISAPQHPLATQREEEEQSKREADADRQAYEDEMRTAGVPMPPAADPQQFQSRQATRPPRAPVKPGAKKPQHPLLQQLRHEFGIGSDEKPPLDVRVADHVWTFTPLTPDLIALAARAADSLSETASEHSLRAKQAAVCFSIVACDGVPIWMMLGLEPGSKDNVDFPLIPKGPIRRMAAIALYGELTDNLRNRLLEALYEAYTDKVDPEEEVASYMSYEAVDHVLWLCPEKDCEHKFHKPHRYDAQERELPYFCELHGTVMMDSATTRPRIDEDLRPLV